MERRFNESGAVITRILLVLLTALLVLVPTHGLALGLGKINVRSALNQTLIADIPILSARAQDLEELEVRIAVQSFVGVGSSSTGFDYEIQTRGRRHFIRLTSDNPIREPLINFLIEVQWPSGRLLREFAVLLNPPGFVTQAQPANAPLPPLPKKTAKKSNRRSTAVGAVAAAPKRKPPVTAAPPPMTASGPAYGPVRRGETLWKIAERIRPDASISIPDMMQALLRANPKAFIRNNINALMAGVTLQVPTYQEITGKPLPATQRVAAVAPTLTEPTTRTAEPLTMPDAEPQPERAEIRLVPPESTDQQASDNRSNTMPVLSKAFRIKLNGDKPQLQVADMNDLRTRIAALADIENEALSAVQPQATAEPELQAVAQPQPIDVPVLPALESASSETTSPAATAPDAVIAENASVSSSASPEAEQPQPVAVAAIPSTDTTSLAAVVENASDAALIETTDGSAIAVDRSDPSGAAADNALSSAPLITTAGADLIPVAATDPEPVDIIQSDWVSDLIKLLDDPMILLENPAMLLENPILFAALAVPIILLLVWLMMRRSAKEPVITRSATPADDEEVDLEVTLPVQTRSSTPSVIVTPAAVPQQAPPSGAEPPLQNSINPMERIDLLMAVGNYREAENVARLALADKPDNAVLWSKMLDIHFTTGNAEKFQEDAQNLRNAVADESNPLWEHALDMGRQLCPEHPLFLSSLEDETEPTLPFSTTQDDTSQDQGAATTIRRPTETTIARVHDGTENYDFSNLRAELSNDEADVEPPYPTSPLSSATSDATKDTHTDDNILNFEDFNWRKSDSDQVSEQSATEPISDQSLDFEFEPSSKPDVVEQAPIELEIDDLELDALNAQTSAELNSSGSTETKLELATAYLDMQDAEGARSLLEEVLQEGDSTQQQRAKDLIARLSA